MSDSITKAGTDYLAAGPVAGESSQTFRNNLKPFGSNLETSLKKTIALDCPTLGNSGSHVGHFIAPFKCEITKISAVKQASSGTGVTATLVNRDAADNTDKNPLSGTNIDMDALATANEAESQTLNSTAANIQMEAGDCCKCTFATDGSSTLTGAAVAIEYKPIA